MFKTRLKSYKTLSLGFALFLLIFGINVYSHEFVGLLLNEYLFSSWTRPQYNHFILALFLAIQTYFIVDIVSSKQNATPKTPWIFGYLSILLLMAISWRYLFVINIEAVHFIQYGGLAFLLMYFSTNATANLTFITLLGAFDEAHQYFILSPDRSWYFDFNDVWINLIGAAWGILLYWRYHKKSSNRSSITHLINWLNLIMILIIGFLLTTKTINLDINQSGSLLKRPLKNFWTTITPDITYHIIGPLEGIVLIGLSLAFFYLTFTSIEKSRSA